MRKSRRAPPRQTKEARSVETLPEDRQWQYEPKWDGFRCLLSRDDDAVSLQSKGGEDLTRYFPELVEAALSIRSRLPGPACRRLAVT
jgi:ATP-dependent DNA ligase